MLLKHCCTLHFMGFKEKIFSGADKFSTTGRKVFPIDSALKATVKVCKDMLVKNI